MPTIGRSNVTRMWPPAPGSMVAELATASTPHVQPPGPGGWGCISEISSGRLPALRKAKRYSCFWLALMVPKACVRS